MKDIEKHEDYSAKCFSKQAVKIISVNDWAHTGAG